MTGVRHIPASFGDKSVSGKSKVVVGVDSLSKRQKEILRLVARHHQVKEIARLLNISEATVRTHTEEARRRLGAATSREAAIVLLRHESGDGRLSEQELLPDSSSDSPEDASETEETQVESAPQAELAPQLIREQHEIPPRTDKFSGWLKQRSIVECIGIILLMALGLTLILIALLASAVTLIQAIQNLTGRA